MEQIVYRKTLDVHKNGRQFLLQGFSTADNLSRVVEISLMQSGDAIDFPLEKIIAIMYVFAPGATEPEIYNCTIKDNKVVFGVPHISEEGITQMQLKLIETSTDGSRSVLGAPVFACEVIQSIASDESIESGETFTRFEDAVAKAKSVYDERFLRMELDSECIFKAYYADGTTYETDVLQRLFRNGNVLLSESWAKGGTGVRAGEDTDNSKYYSNVSRSEALNAKDIMENSKEILEEVRLHGVYTAFSMDFETGEVEYVSPSFSFKVNTNTGELDAEGQSYTFDQELYRVIDEWLLTNDVKLNEIQALADRITPIEKGGTAADNAEDARTNLGVYSKEEICDAETSALFGLPEGSVPNNVLELFGKHWWRKKSTEKGLIISNTESKAYIVSVDGPSDLTPFTVYYGDSISWTKGESEGVFIYTIDNPQSVSLSCDESYKAAVLRGKYFVMGTVSSNRAFFADSDAYVGYGYSTDKEAPGDYVVSISSHKVVANPLGYDLGFVSSKNPNEYQNSPYEEYEYLGVPFEKARSGMRWEIGSYIGTGVYGEKNPNTLTFGFVPKFVIIEEDPTFVGSYAPAIIWFGITKRRAYTSNSPVYFEYQDKMMTWYAINDTSSQQNNWGTEYHYIAIG